MYTYVHNLFRLIALGNSLHMSELPIDDIFIEDDVQGLCGDPDEEVEGGRDWVQLVVHVQHGLSDGRLAP